MAALSKTFKILFAILYYLRTRIGYLMISKEDKISLKKMEKFNICVEEGIAWLSEHKQMSMALRYIRVRVHGPRILADGSKDPDDVEVNFYIDTFRNKMRDKFKL